MGDKQNRPFQLSFNGLLKIDFQGSRITSDGGLILVREWDERLGLSELIGGHLTDHRAPNSRLPLADLFRQSVYSRLAGYAIRIPVNQQTLVQLANEVHAAVLL